MEPVLLNNRYRLLELVGSGGMAVVYKGVDTLLQRRVAVKVLRESYSDDPSFLARFQREARAAAKLDHPNVVTVYDVGQDDDRHYIVMEYVDGQDLKTLIRQKARLSVEETLDVAVQVCAGVGHAHKEGLIHCDIKPQNVLLTHDGRAKVADFGIARALSEAGLTESEIVWGSPLYYSPEQAAGEPPTPASDVYSIGVMMYEMLAGAPPFQAEKPTALALMHMREEPQPLAVRNHQVPAQLEWIVRKVLAKEPAARYRTADQLAHVLEEYRKQSEQMTGPQPSAPSRPIVAPASSRLASQARFAPDLQGPPAGTTWMLGGVALVLVVGLIPLWLAVNRAYSSPPPVPTLTPPSLQTLTPTVHTVAVPDVLQKPVDEARALLEQLGLRMVLQEERDEPGVEGGLVLEQMPASGEAVLVDSEVAVVISKPGRELVMPGVVEYPVDLVRDGLESDGLQVAVTEVWSVEPEGMVLSQEPGADTRLHAGDTVTLTVSGGLDTPIPLDVNFADLFLLKSAELRQETFRPGGALAINLRWQALRSTGTHYVVFVHLVDDPGAPPLAQQDSEPFRPTTEWLPGVEVLDPHQVTIPAGLPRGTYQLRVGMYPRGQPSYQVSVMSAGQTTVESGRILVAELEIAP